MRRKLISCVLALVMLVSMFPMQFASASATPAITVGTASIEIEAGGDNLLYLPINITNNPGVAGITWFVTIPEGWEIDVFDYMDETGDVGSIFTKEGRRGIEINASEQHNEATGMFNIAATDPVDADGVVAWIVYIIPENVVNGVYDIKIESCDKICDENTAVDMQSQFTFNAGTITITGGKEPTVNQATVAWGEANFTYNGEEQVPMATATNEAGEPVDVVVTGGQVNAGTYNATATDPSGVYVLVNATKEFTIAPKKVEVVWDDVALVYNGEEQAPAATVEDSAVQLTVTGAKDAGTHTATAATTNSNYELVNATKEFTIAPKKVEVTWGDTNLVYNAEEQAPTATVEDSAVQLTVTGAKDVGNHVATATASSNYELVGNTCEFVIAACDQFEDVTVTKQNVDISDGKFAAPSFIGLKNEAVEGDLAYIVYIVSNDTYVVGNDTYVVGNDPYAVNNDVYVITDDTIIYDAFMDLNVGDTAIIYYAFDAKGNYVGNKKGTIDVTMVEANPKFAPAAPALSARVSNKSVGLYWTAPNDGGSPITGYQIQVNGGEWTDLAANVTSYIYTNLENGTEYTFSVRAINAVGEGAVATVTAIPRSSGSGVNLPSGGGGSSQPEPEKPSNEVVKSDAAGNKTTAIAQADGSVVVTAVLSAKAVAEAAKNGTAISLPMDAVDVSKNMTITVATGVKNAVKVEIPVVSVTASTVAAIIGADGEMKIVRDCVCTADGVVLNVNDGDKVVVINNSKNFADVAADHWGKNAVAFAFSRSLFAGVSDTKFAPEVAMNRAMLAQVLYNLNYNPNANVVAKFPDVVSGEWYSDAVAWAAEKGIVSGYGNGTYQPDKSVTREELVVMLWNYNGKPAAQGSKTAEFTDGAKVADWAQAAMDWALSNGVLSGKGGKVLDPQGMATRVEVAQMIKNYLENN